MVTPIFNYMKKYHINFFRFAIQDSIISYAIENIVEIENDIKLELKLFKASFLEVIIPNVKFILKAFCYSNLHRLF